MASTSNLGEGTSSKNVQSPEVKEVKNTTKVTKTSEEPELEGKAVPNGRKKNLNRIQISLADSNFNHFINKPFSDLELSLKALEKLDRASPDLWPDHSKST